MIECDCCYDTTILEFSMTFSFKRKNRRYDHDDDSDDDDDTDDDDGDDDGDDDDEYFNGVMVMMMIMMMMMMIMMMICFKLPVASITVFTPNCVFSTAFLALESLETHLSMAIGSDSATKCSMAIQ